MKNRSLLIIVGLMFFSGLSAVDTNSKEIVPTKKGNSWYFNTLEILNLNSDAAKIEVAKQELGSDKIAEITNKGCMDQDKQNEAILKEYNKMHPATYTLTQKLRGSALFTAVVGGFVAYKYFYQSEDKNNEEEIDKN